jgi:phosphatidylserine decarboxylase
MAVKTLTGANVVFRQIAGYVARRIVFYPEIEILQKPGMNMVLLNSGPEWTFSCLWIQK